ncbi:Fur family transcriptional regulator, ferric uptake regulator [Polaribacter sp. KT25b]|uniref:Fur family transcriptional regulator n=1 Tax=Polaribacter sp. KT25b TaxID=1855336 RepID=UPI00087BAA59|nr:transcriptional repressor [Polaribacter sp. KT25b]SDR96737.1 Fur family transcriptional regulator, ferric uptake regulator [Polaribacter sp. KT25b]
MGVIRKTKSVEALLNEFKNNSVAISAKMLIDQLDTKFNKTTIYRVLDKLEDDGVLHSFLGKEGLKWYAKCNGCSTNNHNDFHPHFQCLECGKVDCLDVTVTLPKISNRKIEVSQLLIQGKCEKCLT